jgi:tetratricopeptide (TPR) repeat protein
MSLAARLVRPTRRRPRVDVADIFVSYTSQDRRWAEWIGQELEKLGHVARIDAWEISGGGDIAAWMDERHDKADHILCVVSETYLSKPYSSWERRAGQWAAQTDRPNFVLPVRIEDCKLRTLLASVKYCDLFGMEENEARARLTEFLKPAGKPIGPVPFPGAKPDGASIAASPPHVEVAFPGKIDLERKTRTVSNIPIAVPRHFLGRDDDLTAIQKALASNNGRAAITALHGLRGVGKTTLAAAFAERHRNDYRATWWIRAETESTMRADLVGLGVQFGWVAADAQEEPALEIVMDRLRDEADGLLLVYDNANSAKEFEKYAPRGGAAHIIVTSNAPDWRGIAAPVEIEVWQSEIGAIFLIERTGLSEERLAAVNLSEALGGLPLAHEQAAAYCEHLGISLSDYASRFAAAPGKYLDDVRTAPEQYHNGLTVSKTFALAIDQAAKLHPAAEPLIVHASLLAPEPIPLYLFSEAREEFAEPLASLLKDDGLDEAVGALRAFALVDRESIPDERDASIKTDCIRLHRLVRQVAAARQEPAAHARMRGELIEAMAATYPVNVYNDPAAWLKARRLDAIALALVDGTISENAAHANVLAKLAAYREGALAAYAEALPYSERALAIREKTLGPDHPHTATSLNNLAGLLESQGDLAGARPYYERARAISEKALGPDHPHTATSLNNLAYLLQSQGDLAGARPYYERALAIWEKALGLDHPNTATSLNNLGYLLQLQGDLAGARPYHQRALAIREKALGPDHPDTASSLNNLGLLLESQGDLAGARPHYDRTLAICERALGPDHPHTATSLNNLAGLLESQGDFAGARPYHQRALAIREKALGPDHPDTARSLNNLGLLLRSQGDLAGARPYSERALDICERKLGLAHPNTRTVAKNAAALFDQLKLPNQAAAIREKFGLKDDD